MHLGLVRRHVRVQAHPLRAALVHCRPKSCNLCARARVQDTDGRNALKGLKLMGKMFRREEKWLRKCHAHTAAGNDALEGVSPDPDSDEE